MSEFLAAFRGFLCTCHITIIYYRIRTLKCLLDGVLHGAGLLALSVLLDVHDDVVPVLVDELGAVLALSEQLSVFIFSTFCVHPSGLCDTFRMKYVGQSGLTCIIFYILPEMRGGHNMAKGHDPVQDHSNQLNEHNNGKEDHEDNPERLELQVLVVDLDLVRIVPGDDRPLGAIRPLDVESVLVLLEEVDGDHPDTVEDEEGHDHLVAEVLEALADPLLLLLILVERRKVLGNEVLPEVDLVLADDLTLGLHEERTFLPILLVVLQPVGILHVVPLLARLQLHYRRLLRLGLVFDDGHRLGRRLVARLIVGLDVEGPLNLVQLVRDHHQLLLGVLVVVRGEHEAGADISKGEVDGAFLLGVVHRLEIAYEAAPLFLLNGLGLVEAGLGLGG